MLRSISIGETAEITESAIKYKAFCKVSFRGSITEINKKKCFKETLRIITLSAHTVILRFAEFVDKRKVNTVKENFKRVIRRNHTGNSKVSKGVLNGFSHLMTSIKERFKDFNILRIHERMLYKEFVNLGVKTKMIAYRCLIFKHL